MTNKFISIPKYDNLIIFDSDENIKPIILEVLRQYWWNLFYNWNFGNSMEWNYWN